MTQKGLAIRSVDKTSAAYKSGLRAGDRIVSINEEPVNHELDFIYSSATDILEIAVLRRNRCSHLNMKRPRQGITGVQFGAQNLKRCGNKCVFCFVDQMPPDMRRTLYIKDEDYRHSFLYGNYLTLSCLSKVDFQNIVRLGLSPLYISVHATDPDVRNRMLGNKKAPAILEQLRELKRNGISFHTQVVVCPGLNDGEVLDKTISELLKIGQNLLSIAIVPLGLTRYHTKGLSLVTESGARHIVEKVDRIGEADKKKQGTRRLFLADEFYIKAGVPFPPDSYYGEYPQIENGVGLIRSLLDESRQAIAAIGPQKSRRTQQVAVMTSVSAAQVIKKIIDAINKKSPLIRFTVYVVSNRVFGESVTVAGLLTARDVIRTVRGIASGPDMVLVPGILFNHNGVTLDGYSLNRIARMCRIPVRAASTITELLQKTGVSR